MATLQVCAVRGLPRWTDDDVAGAEAAAAKLHTAARRLALPRLLLARVLEVFVAVDRACLLQAHGFYVDVGVLFDAAVSPRNLVVRAQPRHAR